MQRKILDELHEEVDSEFVLKHILHVHNKRVVNIKQNVFLQLYILKLLIINDNVLPNALHCKELIRLLFQLHQEHLPKSALPYHFLNHEVREFNLVPLPCKYQLPIFL